MINTAVILAAGRGRRLGARTTDKPKGFLVIDDRPIVEHSVRKLLTAGIEKIIIGTGYLSAMYETFAAQYPQIKCVTNPNYATTGSLSTLHHVRDAVCDDFLLLESDLLYEQCALRTLLEHPMADVMLASQFTRSGDEVFLEADAHQRLVNLSKNKGNLRVVSAEMAGITKLSHSTFQTLCQYAKEAVMQNPALDYEHALVELTKTTPIYVHRMENLAWCEIDDETHLDRAINEISPMIRAREGIPYSVKRNVLLSPGPATTTDGVKFAQIIPDICPREKEFGQILYFISRELTKFVADPQEYTTVLFGGSGTTAVESILSSVIGQNTVFIINNGAYGNRMCQIAEACQLSYIEYKSSPYEALDVKAIEQAIENSPHKISHLAVVHHETTTGLLNDVELLGRICNKHHIELIVDAMSSFAAISIDMKRMNISYLAASSNKNLQAMPGVAFVIAHTRRLESTRCVPPRNFYLHLHSQYKFFQDTSQMRFTPPVQTLYALKQAILETRFEGIDQRYRRYSELWETLVSGIARLGLVHLVKRENHAKLITCIVEPACQRYDFHQMHDYFYSHGFTIYPGKLDDHNTFRVANIGDLTCGDMEAFLSLLESYLTAIGYLTI